MSCISWQHQFLSNAAVATKKGKKEATGFWRISQLEVAVDKDPGKDCYGVSQPLLHALACRIGCQPSQLPCDVLSVVRKSFDARKHPRFIYTVDMDVAKLVKEQPKSWEFISRLKHEPGVTEFTKQPKLNADLVDGGKLSAGISKVKVVVVGSGPAGLFAALVMAKKGLQVIVVERGYPVEQRGRHIGSLMVRRILNPDSNFCYGEGGAGTWSDGKLTTRIGKNSGEVRMVLSTLVRFGASEGILVDGKPHIGTDKLVHILRGLRAHLQELGMVDILEQNGYTVGVRILKPKKLNTADLHCDAVVLAVGHSARDVYNMLLSHGITLAPKDFAVGLRIEHPQELINEIRYRAWAAEVRKGKGKVPVADYKLAASVSTEEEQLRRCYSFCMCPGGQIVPTSTDPEHLCINGMSFSKRASKWANAALVVNVNSVDIQPFLQEHGPLAGLVFQKTLEREAANMGGGSFVVPAQTVPDFLEEKITESPLPSSSYRLGVRASPLHELLPSHLHDVLKKAVLKFNQQMPGFIDNRALLHGVETRTSSPVTITRNPDTFESTSMRGLYPIGEGAGYAGGIVSAAVDGMKAGTAIVHQVLSRVS